MAQDHDLDAGGAVDDQRYDRQLRLWGIQGQRRLANCHVLLINASATGAETLKNLVLPGIGEFTIVDGHAVTWADATNNFFVTRDQIGQPRAQTVCEWLQEMNRDVTGHFVNQDFFGQWDKAHQRADQAAPWHDLVTSRRVQLVIASQLPQAQMLWLSHQCQQATIPLLVVHSYGLVGYFRSQLPQHVILNAKNDPPVHELRLACAFPALQAFADSIDLSKLSSIEHAHVPFVVILLQALARWKETHDGNPPRSFAEKDEFKRQIQGLSRHPAGQEVNFTEAVAHAYKAYTMPQVPDDVQQVLDLARTMPMTSETSAFWLLARALQIFVDHCNDGLLPVTGMVPDMTASTEFYVALQQIYVDKAHADAHRVFEILQQVLDDIHVVDVPHDRGRLGRRREHDPQLMEEYVHEFCKNVYNLGVVETRSIGDEYSTKVDLTHVDLEDERHAQSPLVWYFMYRAAGTFSSKFNRFPGGLPAQLDQDVVTVLQMAQDLASAAGFDSQLLTQDHAHEICRYCEVELHNVASLMGGIASQEAIKIITHQFVPLNATYVFNGIQALAATYEL